MKKNLIILILTLFAVAANAQKNAEKAANETCDCMNKEQVPDNISSEEYQKILTNCLANPMVLYYEKICKELKIAADNSQESYEAVGAKIAGKLVENCPKFLKMAMNAEQNKANQPVGKTEEEVGKEGNAIGVVKAIDKKDFYYITIENSAGSKESFIWLRFFKGSTPFENNPAAQVGKKISLNYREIRCFSPELSDYVIKKEITEVNFVD